MIRIEGRIITKEQFKRAMENGGYIDDQDMTSIFNEAERLGYGIYSPIVREENGKYYVDYYRGETCD